MGKTNAGVGGGFKDHCTRDTNKKTMKKRFFNNNNRNNDNNKKKNLPSYNINNKNGFEKRFKTLRCINGLTSGHDAMYFFFFL